MTTGENEKKYVILIAEDEYVNYVYLETLINERLMMDSRILHAKNGVEAIEICRNNRNIDLLLIDLKMPKIDGFEAAKQIREFRPDLPIVAETAYSLKEDVESAISAGCTDFISKPISAESLQKILNKHLSINDE